MTLLWRVLTWFLITSACGAFAQTPDVTPAAAVPNSVPTAAAPAVPSPAVAPKTSAVEPGPAPSKKPVSGESFMSFDDVSRRISFDSLRIWKDSRWFVIGRWDLASESIVWLGGKSTPVKFPKPECLKPGPNGEAVGAPEFGRDAEGVKHTEKGGLSREILARGNWMAIEVDSSTETELFEVKAPRASEVPGCAVNVTLRYGWKGEKTELKPLLFLKPTDYFYDYEITMYAPEKPERANIQLDLYLGYWQGIFPNAQINPKYLASTYSNARGAGYTKEEAEALVASISQPKKSMTFLPTAVSRGEWLLPVPQFKKAVGLTLALEQSLYSLGGVKLQNVQLSDWFVGAFYQQIIAALDGIQFRAFLKYHEHQADQGLNFLTFAEANNAAKNIIVGGTLNHYFLDRWMLGADFEYGFPNRMAGRKVDQSYLAYCLRVGARLTSFLTIITEAGFRNYQAAGYKTESLFQLNGGIRLEL